MGIFSISSGTPLQCLVNAGNGGKMARVGGESEERESRPDTPPDGGGRKMAGDSAYERPKSLRVPRVHGIWGEGERGRVETEKLCWSWSDEGRDGSAKHFSRRPGRAPPREGKT